MRSKIQKTPSSIVIALAKGRILKAALPLLKASGITPLENPADTRKLFLETNVQHLKLLVIRATDVPTFVEYGGADIGITGKDVLLEHTGTDYYEPLDLKIAECRLALAVPVDRPLPDGPLVVATKYPKTARTYFDSIGRQAEIIKLHGSMELAPLVGMSDCIVDLIDTGETLKANGLLVLETICDISSRLIINKAASKTKREVLLNVMSSIRQGVCGPDA